MDYQGNGRAYPDNPEVVMDVYDQHKQAANDYAEACHAFQAAEARREKARGKLQEVSAGLTQIVQNSIEDPTIPKVAQQASNSANYLQGSGRSR